MFVRDVRAFGQRAENMLESVFARMSNTKRDGVVDRVPEGFGAGGRLIATNLAVCPGRHGGCGAVQASLSEICAVASRRHREGRETMDGLQDDRRPLSGKRLKPSEASKRTSRADVAGSGLLVLLAGAEARGKDLLIATARRRYAHDPRLAFPARLATKSSAHDAEHIGVPRRVFRDIEANQGFAIAWQHGGARHGLTAGALSELEAGRIVVLAVPNDAVDGFRAVWPRVEVVPLGFDVDGARPARPVGAGLRPAFAGAEVRHSGDIAQAVRRFHDVLDALTRRQFPGA